MSTKGLGKSGVEYVDYSFNPVTGCEHGCPYCWAERFSHRLAGRFGYPADDPFRPTIRQDPFERLANTRKAGVISVCWMGDLWGEWVPQDWIDDVVAAINWHADHTYLMLTKNPSGYSRVGHVPSPWVYFGTSVAEAKDVGRIQELRSALHRGARLWVSFEPITGPLRLCREDLAGLRWVVFGAMTGSSARRCREPDLDDIRDAVSLAVEMDIPVFVKGDGKKKNLIDLLPGSPQQTPWSP